jgi:glycosyltransferase involved in cell wall biosynthesis
MPKYPRHLAMIAPVPNLQYDSRIVHMANCFAEAGSKVSLITPPQLSDNAKELNLLLHEGVTLHVIPYDAVPEAYCSDLSNFLNNSPSSLQQRLLAHYLSGDSLPYRDSVSKLPAALQHIAKAACNIWEREARRTKQNALANYRYWHLHLKQQLQPRLYKKYSKPFVLDCYNYFYYIHVLMINKQNPIDSIFCHDLWTLPVGCLIKELLAVSLLFDSHEIGAVSMEDPANMAIAAQNEKWMYQMCDRFITVNESLADYFHRLCPTVMPIVVSNAHKMPWQPPVGLKSLKERLSLPEETPVAAYVGSLHPLSHMDLFIRAVARSSSNLCLAILGGGGDIERFRAISTELGLAKRVFFLERVNFEEVHATIFGADFGIIPNIQNHGNLTLISSSKMFDYIQVDMPFISDHGTEIQRVLDGFKIGRTVNFQQDPVEIAKLLDDFYKEIQAGTYSETERKRASQSLVWPANIVEIVCP